MATGRTEGGAASPTARQLFRQADVSVRAWVNLLAGHMLRLGQDVTSREAGSHFDFRRGRVNFADIAIDPRLRKALVYLRLSGQNVPYEDGFILPTAESRAYWGEGHRLRVIVRSDKSARRAMPLLTKAYREVGEV